MSGRLPLRDVERLTERSKQFCQIEGRDIWPNCRPYFAHTRRSVLCEASIFGKCQEALMPTLSAADATDRTGCLKERAMSWPSNEPCPLELTAWPRRLPPRDPSDIRGAGKNWGLGCEVEFCLFETAVRDGGSDLKNPMSTDRCPTHLPLLIHTGIDEAVGGTFGRRTGYRLTGPVSPTVVDDRSCVLPQVSAEIVYQLV